MSEHYFAEQPTANAEQRDIEVTLRGHAVTVATANAVFSADRLDKATRILLDEVPEPPATGAALDIGCGWGPISLSLGLAAPDLDVWALDVNERALELTATNARRLGLERVRAVRAADVPTDLEFDVIWSNPPIRIGKAALDALMFEWLPRLAPGGQAWLVVGKNLGADSLQRRLADAGRVPHPARRTRRVAGTRREHRRPGS
jgi:16S rRNA G1207 methylase RsmC